MAAYRLVIRSRATESIRHLPPDVKRAVRSAIRELRMNPTSGKRLYRELEGLWKYPVHRYRIVYGLDSAKKVIDIVAVGQRRSIYEEVAELLRQEK